MNPKHQSLTPFSVASEMTKEVTRIVIAIWCTIFCAIAGYGADARPEVTGETFERLTRGVWDDDVHTYLEEVMRAARDGDFDRLYNAGSEFFRKDYNRERFDRNLEKSWRLVEWKYVCEGGRMDDWFVVIRYKDVTGAHGTGTYEGYAVIFLVRGDKGWRFVNFPFRRSGLLSFPRVSPFAFDR